MKDTLSVLLLLLLALPFNLKWFPERSRRLRQQSGDESPIIDTWFSYSPQRVERLFGRLGPEGRRDYAVTELSLDLAYPLLYGTFFRLILRILLRQTLPADSAGQRLSNLPLAVMASDYLENTAIVTLLETYPNQSAAVARAASLFTTTKFILGGLSLLATLAALILLVYRKLVPPRGF